MDGGPPLILSMGKVDAGSTTRRATVHSPRGGLKIESPKARDGPRVIIFRSRLENRGNSQTAVMVRLYQDKEQGRFAKCHLWVRELCLLCVSQGTLSPLSAHLFAIRVSRRAEVSPHELAWLLACVSRIARKQGGPCTLHF